MQCCCPMDGKPIGKCVILLFLGGLVEYIITASRQMINCCGNVYEPLRAGTLL